MKTIVDGVIFIVEKTKTGFSAYSEYCPVYTTGRTKEELEANIAQALKLYKEELTQS